MQKEEREALINEIRANVAFEHFVVAVITGAVVCAGVTLATSVIAGLIDGVGAVRLLMGGFLSALSLTMVFFLIGFAASAALSTPLFKWLEKRKKRSPWPYAGAVLAVSGLGLGFAELIPGSRGPGWVAMFAVIVASLTTIFVFSRRMSPVWAALAQADQQAKSAAPVFRLH